MENPLTQIDRALSSLSQLPLCSSLQCAPWYTSKAIGPSGQPDYINTAARIRTSLSPLKLLEHLQAVEDQQGRQRNLRWGARTLDLDLLLYDNVIMNTDRLQLPHPEIENRNFVLLPLHDLEPHLVLPNGNAVSDCIQRCNTSGIARIAQSSTSV